MNQQIFGKFQTDFPNDREFLNIGFSPSSLSIQQRWRNNGLSADFVADYMTTFFPRQSESQSEQQRQAELKHAVSYIANELLENSMKFNYAPSEHSIEFGIHLLDREEAQIVLYATNSVHLQQVAEFQDFIQELLTCDPEELFVLQMERNAENPDDQASRLGFLTMINDYAAQLGWKFTTMPNKDSIILVTTMVQLTV
ncbi:MAG: DUF6272 family protein [Pleurocapsa sp. MO_192.B19]|nr:DUF6272 family protein [Pleurocapsa sp. MO_192.B19]